MPHKYQFHETIRIIIEIKTYKIALVKNYKKIKNIKTF